MHNTAVHRKCHASRHPPDVILHRSFTRKPRCRIIGCAIRVWVVSSHSVAPSFTWRQIKATSVDHARRVTRSWLLWSPNWTHWTSCTDAVSLSVGTYSCGWELDGNRLSKKSVNFFRLDLGSLLCTTTTSSASIASVRATSHKVRFNKRLSVEILRAEIRGCLFRFGTGVPKIRGAEFLLLCAVACPSYAAGVTPAGDAKPAPVRKLAKNVQTVCPVDEGTVTTHPHWQAVHMVPHGSTTTDTSLNEHR